MKLNLKATGLVGLALVAGAVASHGLFTNSYFYCAASDAKEGTWLENALPCAPSDPTDSSGQTATKNETAVQSDPSAPVTFGVSAAPGATFRQAQETDSFNRYKNAFSE